MSRRHPRNPPQHRACGYQPTNRVPAPTPPVRQRRVENGGDHRKRATPRTSIAETRIVIPRDSLPFGALFSQRIAWSATRRAHRCAPPKRTQFVLSFVVLLFVCPALNLLARSEAPRRLRSSQQRVSPASEARCPNPEEEVCGLGIWRKLHHAPAALPWRCNSTRRSGPLEQLALHRSSTPRFHCPGRGGSTSVSSQVPRQRNEKFSPPREEAQRRPPGTGAFSSSVARREGGTNGGVRRQVFAPVPGSTTEDDGESGIPICCQ